MLKNVELKPLSTESKISNKLARILKGIFMQDQCSCEFLKSKAKALIGGAGGH